jgi:cytochrome c553
MKHFALIALLGLASTAAFADDTAAAPAKAEACFACHGPGGHSVNPIYPVLAGQYPNYLEHALHEYKDGKRKSPIMGGQAAGLSAEEMHALAQYFGHQDTTLYTPSVHGALK